MKNVIGLGFTYDTSLSFIHKIQLIFLVCFILFRLEGNRGLNSYTGLDPI